MWVCVCVCVCVRARACMCVCAYACERACMCACMPVCFCCFEKFSGKQKEKSKKEENLTVRHSDVYQLFEKYMQQCADLCQVLWINQAVVISSATNNILYILLQHMSMHVCVCVCACVHVCMRMHTRACTHMYEVTCLRLCLCLIPF